MSVALTPRPEQAEWIKKFVESDARGGIIGAGVGQGKTLVATEIARQRGARRVIIMAPESTFDSWFSTVRWQTGETLRRCASNALKFTFTPDPDERDKTETVKLTASECKANMAACQDGESGYFFVTRELFTTQTWSKIVVKREGKEVIDPKTGKPRTTNRRKDVWSAKRPFDIAIADEVQRFAKRGNRGQQSWRNLGAHFRVGMSADWFGSSIDNQWNVANDIFGEEGVGGMNFATWADEYLEREFDPFSYDKKKTVGEIIPGLFASTLPLYITAPPSVIPPEPEKRYVTLSRAERELYDRLEKNFVALVGDEILSVDIPLVLRIRLRELSMGMFEVERTGEVGEDGIEKTTISYPPGAKSAKLDEIKSILSEHEGEKFIIFTHSSKWARWAANELGNAEAMTGATPKSERARFKDEFTRGDLRVIVAHPGTVGTGTDGLQMVCSKVILASRVDAAAENLQAIGRIARQGQAKPVSVFDIVARDSYDDGQLANLRARVEQNDAAKGWK